MNPVPGERPEWVSSELFPFTSRFIALDGHVVHYIDEGAGPMLLLLHGNPVWSFVYRDVVRELAGQFRCVAVDFPGFGLSSAADGYRYLPEEHAAVLDRFVAALGLSDITLVVNDWGGPIGLAVAGHRPELFSRLVIGNSWAWPVEGDPHFARFSAFVGGPVGRVLVTRVDPFFNLMVSRGHARRRPTPVEAAQYRGPFPTPRSRIPCWILIGQIVGAGRWLAGVEQGLGRLAEHPVLLLWGERDAAFRSRERERFERLFPAATTVRLPDAGNFIAGDAPEEVITALRAWHPLTATF